MPKLYKNTTEGITETDCFRIASTFVLRQTANKSPSKEELKKKIKDLYDLLIETVKEIER